MRWVHVEEDVPPEDDRLRWCYSEVYESYHAAKWTAARGWVSQNDEQYSAMTHWSDVILETPFEIGGFNEEMAKSYGIYSDRGN